MIDKNTKSFFDQLKKDMSKVLSYLSNIDNNYKLLLNRISELEGKVDRLNLSRASASVEDPDSLSSKVNNEMGQIHLPNVRKQPDGKSIVVSPGGKNDKTFQLDENDNPKPPEEYNVEPVEESGPMRQVKQIVKDKNDNPVLKATVDIFDSSGSLTKHTKTRVNGSWFAALQPGNYNIKIRKKFEDGESLALDFPLEVSNNKEPLELSPPKLK